MKIENLNTLLSVDKYALKDLHTVLGIDFNKPFYSAFIAGKYTVNQILKTAENNGFTVENSIIAICTRDSIKRWNKDFSMVTLCGNTVNIEYRFPYHEKGRGLDWFCRKSDFEEIRKSNTAETFVFMQKKENTNKPKEKETDYTKRFNLISFDKCFVQSTNKHYINRIYLQQRDASGEKITFENIGRIIYTSNNYEEDINSIIDKSGYFVKFKREKLKRRACALRAERRKAAFEKTNNTAKIETLEKMIAAKKESIIKSLEKAQTYEELKSVYNSLSVFRGFAGIVFDFENLKENDAKKAYSSIENFEAAYNRIIFNLKGE